MAMHWPCSTISDLELTTLAGTGNQLGSFHQAGEIPLPCPKLHFPCGTWRYGRQFNHGGMVNDGGLVFRREGVESWRSSTSWGEVLNHGGLAKHGGAQNSGGYEECAVCEIVVLTKVVRYTLCRHCERIKIDAGVRRIL